MRKTRVKIGLLGFEYRASLHIEHPLLDPNVVSHTLQMKPRSSHRAGDQCHTPKGTPLPGTYPTAIWSADLDTREGEDIAEFLSRIACDLSRAEKFLLGIVNDGECVECYLQLFASRLCDQILPATLLRRLGELGINLRMDYYHNSKIDNDNLG
jgi:uncharacterized protein DUF4279